MLVDLETTNQNLKFVQSASSIGINHGVKVSKNRADCGKELVGESKWKSQRNDDILVDAAKINKIQESQM